MPSAITNLIDRLNAAQRARPWLGDVAPIVVLLAVLLPAHAGGPPDSARAFTIALVLPLVGRRRWPVGTFCVITVIALAQWFANVRSIGDVALLAALYSVAVSRPTRTAVAAFAVVELGVVLAVIEWGDGEQAARAFISLTGMAVAAAVLGTSMRNRRALVASLQDRAERLEHERDQQGRLSAAAERARIAREMHDIVAHNVSVMIALADGASYVAGEDPTRAEEAMRSVSRTGRQALTEMRRLLGVLRDEDHEEAALAPQPGLGELDALLDRVRAAGLPVGYEVSGRPAEPITAGLQLAVYRIVQEALTNTLKHGGTGATAQLAVRHQADRLEVEISDTGVSRRSATPGAGAGLRGMRERAAVYEGTVDAAPASNGGWRVLLSVPNQPAMVTA